MQDICADRIDAGALWSHWPSMVHAAYGVLGDRDAAAECASEAVAQVLEREPADVSNMEAFLVTVAKRRAIDRVRQLGRQRRAQTLSTASDEPHPDVADAVCDQSEASWVDATARELLTPEAYDLLRRVAAGHTVAQAADSLGMSFKSAESKLRRARLLLRAALAGATAVASAFAGGLRRAGYQVTATTAVAAVSVAFISGAPDGSVSAAGGVGDARPMPYVAIAVESGPTAHWKPLLVRGPRAVSTRLSRRRRRLSGASSNGNVKLSVSPPIGTLTTYPREDGYQPKGPVDRMEHCADTLEVSKDPITVACS